MLTIKSINSSSAGNCYVLSDGKTRLMIECGIPWKKALAGLDYRIDDVAGCLCSHGHQDHSKGIRDAAKAGVDVYMSAGTADEIGATGHRVHRLPAGKVQWIGCWAVMPFLVEHDAAEPFGFLIVNGQSRVLFLTDTAFSRYRFKDITYLIIEANYSEKIVKDRLERGEIDQFRVDRLIRSHMSIERVKELIGANSWPNLRYILLCHLSRENSNERLFKEEIQSLTGVPVYIAGE